MTYTEPTTRADGDAVTASIWNTDLVDNIDFLASLLLGGTALGSKTFESEIGALVKLKSGNITADTTSVSLTGYTALTPKFYLLVVSGILTNRAAATNDSILITFNSDTTAANYNTVRGVFNASTGVNTSNSIGTQSGISMDTMAAAANADAGCYGMFMALIFDPENTSDYKHAVGVGGMMSDTANEPNLGLSAGIWLATSAITTVGLAPAVGTSFLAGGANEPAAMKYDLYGGL